MALSQDRIEHARDLFAGLGDIATRRMMGGVCLYHQGTIFAIMRSDGAILIKGAGAFADRLDALGCDRWTYARATGGTAAMPYWSLPEAALDDPEVAATLAREALAHLR